MPLLFGSLYFVDHKKTEHSTLTNFRLATFSASIANFSCVVFERPKFGKIAEFHDFCDFSQKRAFFDKKRWSPCQKSFFGKNDKKWRFAIFAVRQRPTIRFSFLTKKESSSESEEFCFFSKTKSLHEMIDLRIISFEYRRKPRFHLYSRTTARGNGLFDRF